MNARTRPVSLLAAILLASPPVCAQSGLSSAVKTEPAQTPWRQAEAEALANHVQLTFADRFYKAGESYFSPDDSKIIFQAIENPKEGEEPSQFYAMFVADLARSSQGRITGLANIKRLSPEGSANTCGWFHPTDPNIAVFASTINEPSGDTPPQFERLAGRSDRYRWMFPREMRIVKCDIRRANGSADTLELIEGDELNYQAEGSLSADGRTLLYCSLESGLGDLYTKNLKTGEKVRIVGAAGYDGGPFFSPDGSRVCYRSDRRMNDYLQLFVGDLAFNESGDVVGLEREYQLTDENEVNWCPFWHPSGRFLVYATSKLGHTNYEIFMVDADPGNLSGSNGTIRYGTRERRITHADRADVLPVFNSDGSLMMWTSQRGADKESQVWVADFVLDIDASPVPEAVGDVVEAAPQRTETDETVNVTDPTTGLIYIYDRTTHEVRAYNPQTHEVRPVDPNSDEMLRVSELFGRGG